LQSGFDGDELPTRAGIAFLVPDDADVIRSANRNRLIYWSCYRILYRDSERTFMRSKSATFISTLAISWIFLSCTFARADDFMFSFTNASGNVPGTVTGRILGITNNTTGAAAQVTIDSYPSGFYPTPFTLPINVTLFPNQFANSFTETAGVITSARIDADTQFSPTPPNQYVFNMTNGFAQFFTTTNVPTCCSTLLMTAGPVSFTRLASSAPSQTTYFYRGNPFTGFTTTPSPYTTSNLITGSFTSASPLTPNLMAVDITSAVLTYSFTDGSVNTINQSTATEVRFVVSTDSQGNIIAWDVTLISGNPPTNGALFTCSRITTYFNSCPNFPNDESYENNGRITAYVNSAPGVWGYGNLVVPNGGGISLTTVASPNSGSVNVFHARLQEITGSDPAGVAIFGLRVNGVLVSEAGVPASPEISSGRIYTELHGAVHTGIALANENTTDAAISFYFTTGAGQDTGLGSFTLPAGHQIASFLDQPPFNAPADIVGTFTFSSSVPLGAIALRGLVNERNEFLITTLPVPPLSPMASPAILPHFADGGGWSTLVILTNTTDTPLSGTVRFFSQGSDNQAGQLLMMTINGTSGSTFSYSIPPHGTASFLTASSSTTTQVGSVQVAASFGLFSNNNAVPAAVSILAYRNGAGITVSEASVQALPLRTAFRTYLQASPGSDLVGSIQSGVAIANPSPTPVTVAMQLTNLDGTPTGLSQAINVPAGGQIAEFINELFPQLPATFQGVGRILSSSAVAVAALRGRYNERGDFLMTTTPPFIEGAVPSTDLVFPHIVSGLGFTTQIVLFGSGGSAQLYLLGQDGTVQPLSVLAQP
jgi:hypothetical protein